MKVEIIESRLVNSYTDSLRRSPVSGIEPGIENQYFDIEIENRYPGNGMENKKNRNRSNIKKICLDL